MIGAPSFPAIVRIDPANLRDNEVLVLQLPRESALALEGDRPKRQNCQHQSRAHIEYKPKFRCPHRASALEKWRDASQRNSDVAHQVSELAEASKNPGMSVGKIWERSPDSKN
jgi:hypothetical protein